MLLASSSLTTATGDDVVAGLLSLPAQDVLPELYLRVRHLHRVRRPPGGLPPLGSPVRILGIETSCDETAAAVVEDGRRILSNVVASQADLHARYGGVVPEVASRQHLESIVPVVEAALEEARCRLADLDAIAVTYGPGLPGSLLVGLNAAKALAFARTCPSSASTTWRATSTPTGWSTGPEPVPSPLLGPHRLRRPHRPGADGGARPLSPPGPHPRRRRRRGLRQGGAPPGPGLPRRPGHRAASAAGAAAPSRCACLAPGVAGPYDFSFSGLKTAVLRLVRGELGDAPPAAGDGGRLPGGGRRRAGREDRAGRPRERGSGDPALRRRRRQHAAAGGAGPRARPCPLRVPPPALCTDNGAMIAACAYYRFQAGQRDSLDLDIQPGLRIG